MKNLEITDAQAKYILELMEENQHWSILQGEKS
jgi:hypothetical protein